MSSIRLTYQTSTCINGGAEGTAVELYVTVYSSTSTCFVSPGRRANTANVTIHATSSPVSIHMKKICDDVIATDDASTWRVLFQPASKRSSVRLLYCNYLDEGNTRN